MKKAKTIRSKFRCNYINEFEDNKTAHLHAVYEGTENKQWADATPGGSLQITLSKDKSAKDFFEQGKDYFLDFTEV